MRIHDQYSGYVQEVPDQLAGYGLGEPVYDGFGNPVGFSPLHLIANAMKGLFGKKSRPPGAPPQALGQPFPLPMPFARPPWPLGWQRAPLPYTGLGPRRVYMRCALWPGPAGLTPAFAANMPPGAPGMPGVPALPAPGGGGRGRGRRRRRR